MNWNNWLLENEIILRLSFFFGVFAIVALWEWRAPRRTLVLKKSVRWFNNLLIIFINSLILRLIFPTAAVGIAFLAQQNNWGFFNVYQAPLALSVIASVIILDFTVYLQHVIAHSLPLLWRIHRVHHVDLDYDVTTGARFHPLEIILSILVKFSAILLLGVPVIAVIIFEIMLNATAMFNHGNIKLPKKLDKIMRWFLVTPDMHRIHHSIERDETNSNFGFSLTWWDRIFGTYKEQARAGQTGMTIGIHNYTNPKETNHIWGMLMLPFKKMPNDYFINSKDKNIKED
jgi:sterol desaturase/sphingolipid hydroxylase (fatty acid hydroxylase superfamily)